MSEVNVIRFGQLTIRNFMSFGNAPITFDLSTPGTVLVEGRNMDRGGSNGSGKTSIINALCYALFNKPFDNISLNRLINTTNASKNTMMEVSLSFSKGDDEYSIRRTRGAEFVTTVIKNGIDVTPGKGVTETDAFIQNIIGISFELFTRTVIFSGNTAPFLELPIAQQRNLVEELFNISILTEMANNLRLKIRTTEDDIKVQNAVVAQQQTTVELYEKQVREAERRVNAWDTTTKSEVTRLESIIKGLEGVDFESEQLLHAERDRLRAEGDRLATQYREANKAHQLLTTDITKLMNEQQHLEDAKCPYCLQKYGDAKVKLAETIAKIDSLGGKLLDLDDKLSKLKAEDQARAAILTEVEAAIQHQNFTSLLNAKANLEAMTAKLEELKTAVNPHTEALQQLIDQGAPKVESEKIDALKKRLDHQQFLLKLFTNKDSFVRHRILSKNLPLLNGRLNVHTKRAGLPHVVKFDADMSCTVSEFGRELDFGNLSAGEKKRVNTAMSLAFNEVRNLLHAKIKSMMVDEIDGALDHDGLDAIVKILKDKARDEECSVFVISHHPAITGRLERTITIQKEQGFSSVV